MVTTPPSVYLDLIYEICDGAGGGHRKHGVREVRVTNIRKYFILQSFYK